jgi:hypothetical protein
MIDPTLSLAISVSSNKGIYTLLLGSGISRSAGIPTGWEVVVDLVKTLAQLQGEDVGPDPVGWYKETFSEEPNYSQLLDALAKSPSERNQLLRRYFEPSEEEREQRLKVPTAAHRAIAELVANGSIRIILTTNFDRLMEQALEATGVVPTVISTSDAVEGALPLAHTRCTIIKLHGDYLDTRIKNTPDELESYDPRFNTLLDRIFDEYGLIVCGWSAEWDPALRTALERCRGHRFTTYWVARGEPREAAKRLIALRRGVVVAARDADTFFVALAEKVTALEEMNRPHPLSAKVAIATVKKYLVDERARIRLHDLVMEELNKLDDELSITHFPADTPFTREEFLQRVQRYEALSEVLLAVFITGCYWGEQPYQQLWARCLERLAYRPQAISGVIAWIHLSLYPALLLLYGGGIAALAAGRYDTFAILLTKAMARVERNDQPFVLAVNTWEVMETDVAQQLPNIERHFTPLSDHLYEVLRESLKEYLPLDVLYQECFDRFEYLLALVHADLRQKLEGRVWGPIGCFEWRGRGALRRDDPPIMKEIESEVEKAGEDWPLLTAGLFDSSVARFQAIKTDFDAWVRTQH